MDTYSEDHPETLEEKAPYFLVHIWNEGTSLLTSYGWYVFAVVLVLAYYWERIQSYLDKRYKEQSNKEYEAKYKKDPDLLHETQLKMEAARKKMQEENDLKAALYAEKMKEKEEKKREELLASNPGGGSRLGAEVSQGAPNNSSASSVKKAYRPEYNPLMGSGGSGGYRPQRRGCPGGGCG